jgi:methylated-DNA-[protein]-cysteine S-methyltransferase
MNFSEKVLALTKKIPKGKVTTYSEIAKALNTKAYRAVGSALRNNKTPILIPCHRVINSDGNIGSYKGIKDSNEKVRLLKGEGVEVRDNRLDLKKYLFRF